MFSYKSLKDLCKLFICLLSYPFQFLILLYLNEKKIHNYFYKGHFSISERKNFQLIKILFDLNYPFMPNAFKKKLINSSMGDENESIHWAEYYRAKGFSKEMLDTNFAYKYLLEYIKINDDKNYIVHQICASSAREINYFSRLSKSITFEASDFTKSVTELMKKNYPQLNCYCVDITDERQISYTANRCNLIIAFGGLQYLLNHELKKFFNICFKEKCDIIISQPLDSTLNPYKLKNSVYRGGFSWSHPYLNLASKAGYNTKVISSSFDPKFSWAQTIYAQFNC